MGGMCRSQRSMPSLRFECAIASIVFLCSFFVRAFESENRGGRFGLPKRDISLLCSSFLVIYLPLQYQSLEYSFILVCSRIKRDTWFNSVFCHINPL